RFLARHVDAGVAQQFDRIFRGAGTEERQIALSRLTVALENLLGQGFRRGEGRCVLEYVKAEIEMWDVAPFVAHVIVNDADTLVVAVVLTRDFEIQLVKPFSRDRLPPLSDLI